MRGGVLVFVCGVLASSCSGSATPSAPSNERVSGVWVGHATLRSATGGECVGGTLQAAIGSRDVFAALIQQSEGDLAAAVTYQGSQTSCAYTGSVKGFDIDLRMTSCRAGRIVGFQCADGTVRDLEMASTRVIAGGRSGTGRGTDTSSWRVLAPGGAEPLGILSISADFTWNVLGIPHDDFHIFDGSILPGYVDGIVTIPEEDNPFCTECGWF